MSKFAYIRVSISDQNKARQLLAISDLHIPQKISTSTTSLANTSTVPLTGVWFGA